LYLLYTIVESLDGRRGDNKIQNKKYVMMDQKNGKR